MTTARPPCEFASKSTAVQSVDSERLFFDEFVREHGDYDVLGDGAYHRLVSIFERHVQPKPGARCVDLGCGSGAFTRRLRHLGLVLTGIDISSAAVEIAQRQATSERFTRGDITDTGAPSGSQDIVVYSGVLHHFPTAEERARVLKEGYRLLAPGGRLFAFDPNLHSPSMWLYRDPRSPLFSPKGKTENEVLLSRGQLRTELRGAGFSELTVFGVSGITYTHVGSKAARLLLPIYNVYEKIMKSLPTEPVLGTFVVSIATK